MTEMTNEQLLSLADLMVEQGSTFKTPKYFNRLVELARIGASVMPRPRLSMEMLASLEETWEAMEAVGEYPKDAAALRALLDWHYSFSTPPKEHTPSAWPHMNVKGEWEDQEPTP